MTTSDQEMRDLIISSYRGELFGEALFGALQGQWSEPGAEGSLVALAQLEHEMGTGVAPLLDMFDIAFVDHDDAAAAGRAHAESLKDTPWPEFLESFAAGTATVLARYRRLAALAPPSAAPTVDLLIAHEEAIEAFAAQALAGQAGALEPIVRVTAQLRVPRPSSPE